MKARVIFENQPINNVEIDEKTFDVKLVGGIGPQGSQGPRGWSAYQVAKENGFEGTQEEWLISLRRVPVDFRGEGNFLQWKHQDQDTWHDLIDLVNDTDLITQVYVDVELAKKQNAINELAQNTTDAIDELAQSLSSTATEIRGEIADEVADIEQSISAVQESIPTNVSQLNNDAEYADKNYVDGQIDAVQSSIPTNVSDLTNDSNFTTQTYVDTELAKKIDDVQINGTSIVNNSEANIPLASSSTLSVVKATSMEGLYIKPDGAIIVNRADAPSVKAGTAERLPIVPSTQDLATFYGLAKSAGDTTQSASSNIVGIYTDEAKGAIQHMIGTDNLAPYESDITADQSYSIGELFMLHGKLHRAIAAINELDVFTVGTNCKIVNASDVFARDVRVNGTSVVSDGIAEIPKAIDNSSSFGVVGIEISFGIRVNSSGKLYTYTAGPAELKQGSQAYKLIVPANQHSATFYGLAKAAGDSTQSASNNAVGTYIDSAKTAIQTMLDVPSTDIIGAEFDANESYSAGGLCYL